MSSSSSPCMRVNQRSSAGTPPGGQQVVVAAGLSTSSAPRSVACSRSGSRSRVGAETAGRQRRQDSRCAETMKTPGRTDGQGSALRPDNTPDIRSSPSRPPVLHRLAACAATPFAPRPRRQPWRSQAVSSGPKADRRRVRGAHHDDGDQLGNPHPGARRRRGLAGRRHDRHRRPRRVHRGGILPGLPGRQDVDRPAGRRPEIADRALFEDAAGPQYAAGPATFNTPWAQLSPARQAAVIVAVQAGADSLCD